MLARLKAKLSSLTLGITTVTGVNLVSFVGKHRECLLPNVMEALTNFFHETMANSTKFDPHTVYCVTKAIRFGLLGNIKRTPNKVEWNASLVEALEKLCKYFTALLSERNMGTIINFDSCKASCREISRASY